MNTINTNNTAHSESVANRFLIDHPTLGWQLYPLSDALLVYQGELSISEYANQSLRVALAHIELADGKPTTLQRLEFSGWHVDAEGHVDQDAVMRGIVDRIDPAGSGANHTLLASVPVTETDITAIKQCLGIA